MNMDECRPVVEPDEGLTMDALLASRGYVRGASGGWIAPLPSTEPDMVVA